MTSPASFSTFRCCDTAGWLIDNSWPVGQALHDRKPARIAQRLPALRFLVSDHERKATTYRDGAQESGPDGPVGEEQFGRRQGEKNRATTAGKRSKHRKPVIGTAFVHTAIDDHSRVPYAEIHDDETGVTATGVLRRAVAWYAARGVTTRRVLSDNGSAYKSHLWRGTCAELNIAVKWAGPYWPQTNGKIERFHRALADGWALLA